MTSLDLRADLPEGITLDESGGLPAVKVSTTLGEATVYLHGAHVAHWQPTNQAPVLWMSADSHFQDTEPIRGGVPICFPWFGPGRSGNDAPGHGFARLVTWRMIDARVDQDQTAVVVFELRGEDITHLPGADTIAPDFVAQYTVTVGAGLGLSLQVTAGETTLDFEEALHTYFAVSDIYKASVEGLDGVPFWNKVTDENSTQEGAIIFDREIDRVYQSPADTQLVDEGEPARRITISKQNSASTIVWNPWISKSVSMPDFGDDEYRSMVCVESGNVKDKAIQIAPGQSHTMSVRYTVSG